MEQVSFKSGLEERGNDRWCYSVTQKINDPKVFKLGIGNDLGIFCK